MKTVVTGGAGLIGSHLVKKLLEQGREVVVIDDLSSGQIEKLETLDIDPKDIAFEQVDLRDHKNALKAINGADTVFHLAARIGGIKYLHGDENSELTAWRENLLIDSSVFKACQECGVKKVIYASSSATYPTEKQYLPGTILSEKDLVLDLQAKDPKFLFDLRVNPDGGYGFAKLLGEMQLNLSTGFRSAMARIFNVYGINEPLDERSHAISDLIRKAMFYPEKGFTIWGDGNQTRDYLYVSDCAEAFLKLEEKISGDYNGPLALNIGSGRGTPIREIAETAIRISGKKIEPEYDLSKPVGPISRTADMSKTKAVLGWEPKISIAEGLEKTYRWIEEKIL